MRFAPTIPTSTGLAKYLGLDFTQVQPPLPKGTSPELEGTDRWCKMMPLIWSSKTSLGWFDMNRGRLAVGQSVETREEVNNWWPGLGRWRIGMKMDSATIEFEEAEYWP